VEAKTDETKVDKRATRLLGFPLGQGGGRKRKSTRKMKVDRGTGPAICTDQVVEEKGRDERKYKCPRL
jgi:hypothetical protein